MALYQLKTNNLSNDVPQTILPCQLNCTNYILRTNQKDRKTELKDRNTMLRNQTVSRTSNHYIWSIWVEDEYVTSIAISMHDGVNRETKKEFACALFTFGCAREYQINKFQYRKWNPSYIFWYAHLEKSAISSLGWEEKVAPRRSRRLWRRVNLAAMAQWHWKLQFELYS